jgi:hypothetical protein
MGTGGTAGTGGDTPVNVTDAASFMVPDGYTIDVSTTGQVTVVVLPDGATVLDDGSITGGVAVKLSCDTGVLVVSGQPKTSQCSVQLPDGSLVTNVVWQVDDTRIGSIGSDGVFSANGWSGGVVTITAKFGSASIKTQVTVEVAIRDNAGSLTAADIDKLIAGGTGGPNGVGPDAALRWLYPFDETVFPMGLQPPLLQVGGTCADLTYLKLAAPHFLYEQFAKGAVPTQITIPQAVWDGLTLTAGPTDSVTASVSKSCTGQVTGPAGEAWHIAPGKLKGVVYYATYASPDFNNLSGIIRLRLGSQAERFLQVDGQCTVCHSVSANGEVLATGINWPGDSVTFDLRSGAVPPPQMVRTTDGPMFSFAALTPDGRRAFTSGGPNQASVRGQETSGPSRLVDTSNAQVISAPSLPVQYAQTPSFSPDGAHVAFNNSDVGLGHLGMMDYDGSQNPPLFSNLKEIAANSNKTLGWPSFLPDSQAIIYQEGTTITYDKGYRAAGFETSYPAELRLVEIAGGTVRPLGALNGYNPDGSVYLPAGATGDVAKAQGDDWKTFEPTVLPRPIGGYYWVMFSSRRTYGNTLAPGGTVANTADAWLEVRKKIWVAAIDVNHAGKPDPSHPAFYLPGQALKSSALRPFVALEPCQAQGASCESGVDCCDGFCRETGRAADGTPILQCVPPPPASCSNLDEACVTAADCCDPTNLCILGRCALLVPDIK